MVAAWFCAVAGGVVFFLLMSQMARTTSAMSATPPTTPPTMGPIGVSDPPLSEGSSVWATLSPPVLVLVECVDNVVSDASVRDDSLSAVSVVSLSVVDVVSKLGLVV